VWFVQNCTIKEQQEVWARVLRLAKLEDSMPALKQLSTATQGSDAQAEAVNKLKATSRTKIL